MERNREARRASILGSNGFNRRRHRTNSLRDSPDEDGGVELQESVRLRDRVKKDRDRERERDLRERPSRSKRRRADETSEESVNDDEDDEYEESTGTAAAAPTGVRLLPPPPGSISNHSHLSNHHHGHNSSLSQQHNSNSTSNIISSNQHLQHRKTFPPSSSSSKVFRAAPVWKPGDEIISVSVPRKARSACIKRSHDWISSNSNNNCGGGAAGGEPILRQASSSPVRQGIVSTSTPSPAASMSPSSSNALVQKKPKLNGNNGGLKLKPPKVSSKQSSSNPEELEIEIAEVLYGLRTQSQGPSSKKEDSREVNRSKSPISNSTSANNPILNPSSSTLQAVAPKRKRPRQVLETSSYGARSSPVSVKFEVDQMPKSDISSPNLEKISGSTAENGIEMGGNSVNSQGQPLQPPESTETEFKPVAEELRENRDLVAKEEVISPKEKESPVVRIEECIGMDSTVASATIKANSMVSEVGNQRAEKFEIDLMAPPPQARSSPERETKIHLRAQVLSVVDAELKAMVSKDKEDEKGTSAKNHSAIVAVEERKGEEVESEKEIEIKGRSIDLQLDLEKPERDENAGVNATGNKSQQQQEVPLKATREESLTEKSCQSKSSLPLPVSIASWPGGLPPMSSIIGSRYMAPLQGVVSMDGSSVTPAPVQQLFSQPRLKRCATHCYIARNIHCLQQFMKMNPFWPASASSASLFGSKGVTKSDVNLASTPNQGSQSANISDSSQRRQQILIQQALPPVAAPSNLLGPAFFFPLNQQQAAVAASAQPGAAKSPTTAGGVASSNASSSAGAMSFNYPNMAANETQYLAILQNNPYPFPIASPNYRGTPPQAMPLFNGPFYSSQMIHHQNASLSSSSLTSQKHSQSQHQRPQSSGVDGGAGSVNLQNFPSQKSQPSQQLQQSHDQHVHPSSRARHLEGELGGEDSPTTDNRGSWASMNIYGQNFPMPIHAQNFALMTPPPALASSNQSEKKPQQPPSHSFAMSFGPINASNTGPGINITSMAQNHAIFQSFPEATRQNIQMMAAAQVAQKKNFRMSEDDKSGGGDSSATDDETKSLAAKPQAGVGQSTAFMRSDLADAPVSSIQANSVIESSVRSLNVASVPARSAQPITTNAMVAINAPNVHNQGQLQQQQMLQLQQQQQLQQQAANAAMAAKFPNALSGFPQNLVQINSSSPTQSPQWRSSARTLTSQAPSSLPSSTAKTLNNVPQQHSRTPTQMQAQISFGGNQKPSTTSQGQAPPSTNPAPSPHMMVGSPTTSSISKGASGRPRASNSASMNNKVGQQASSLSAQQPKSSPSTLGNHHTASSSSNGAKPQMQQQSQLQQPKNMQQAQLFFSNPYSPAQSPHLTCTSSTTPGPSGFYMQQQRRLDQAQEPAQQPPAGPSTNSTGASTSTNDPAKAIAAATCNVKGGGLPSHGIIHAAQYAAQSAGTLLPAGFSYVHPVPAAVQVKPAEQKQPAA